MQQGREHPWHIRRVSHKHLHDQRNLVDLQLLTYAWTPETPPPSLLEQEFSLLLLEDDTWPEDVLSRLEQTIRAQQLRVLGGRLKEVPALAARSFQAGQESAQKRWMQSDPTLGSIAPADKRALLLTLFHGALAGRLGPAAFLIRRALVTEVSVELLQCPHRLAGESAPGTTAPEAPETIDELCRQQFNWLRGYCNFLNPAITPAYSRPRGRCVVSW